MTSTPSLPIDKRLPAASAADALATVAAAAASLVARQLHQSSVALVTDDGTRVVDVDLARSFAVLRAHVAASLAAPARTIEGTSGVSVSISWKPSTASSA